jgi:hypothetical protein
MNGTEMHDEVVGEVDENSLSMFTHLCTESTMSNVHGVEIKHSRMSPRLPGALSVSCNRKVFVSVMRFYTILCFQLSLLATGF